MKQKTQFAVVLVTAPDPKTARKLAQSVLRHRLAACVNLVPVIESHYWWQGKIAKGAETLMVLKTTVLRLVALEELILSEHPYDTPEFVVLPIQRGNRRFLDWLKDSVKARPRTKN